MKKDGKHQKIRIKKSNQRLFKSRKKRSTEEDSAIQYLQGQYDKILPDELKTFKDFPLSQKTLRGLKDHNYIKPTDIQRQAIGFALQGKDILGAAKTGSGKTLAFLIPILEILFCKKWTRLDGVGALVISPTRELAYQIYEILRKVGQYHDFSAGLVIGGQNLKFERKRMDQMNILICTPGRLLQHMDENPLFDCGSLQILVLDEADRCLDMGFETTMNGIIENLPPKRQTLLFSATQTKSVKDLARLSLSFPSYIAPHELTESITPDSLQQSYIVCEIEEKVGILWSFIRNHLKQKVIVFMATCKQVKFIYELFCKLRPGVSLLALYGTLHQEKRERIYEEFCRKSNVVLFATDLASRGLDFPRINWVIQYDCPENVDTYIHRAGRTARGFLGKGDGLLMLLPNEETFGDALIKSKIPINKISVDPSKVMSPQRKIEALLSDNTELKQTAQRAFVSYLKSVFTMKNKELFNVQLIDTDAYAKSLGLIIPPRIRFLQKLQTKNLILSRKDTENHNHDNNDNVFEKIKTTLDVEDSDQSIFSEDEQDIPEKKSNKKQSSGTSFNFHNEDDSEEEDFLQVKKQDIELELSPIETPKLTKKKTKPVTKAAIAKKILKKKIKVNTTTKFTDDGQVIENEKKDVRSELAKQFVNEDVGGIDIEKAKEVLQEEDKFDKLRFREKVKAKHKEQKRKLKNKNKEEEGEKDDFGSESGSEGPDLSWLPDPDKVYGNMESTIQNNSESQEYNNGNQIYLDSDEEKYHRLTKRKLVERRGVSQDSVKPRKVKKIEDISASLTVDEAEALAMQLLHNNK